MKPGELAELGRQLLVPKRLSNINQHRDDPHTGLQRCLNLEGYPVVLVAEPLVSSLIGKRPPLAADQDHQHHARNNRLPDIFLEVRSPLNGVQIHEDARVRESLAQLALQRARVRRSIPTAVAEEDPP
jgi:hypothetical protein